MVKLQFKTTINASAESVYNAMLGKNTIETYQQWTSVFNPTSTYEGGWDKGAKIYFIGTDENGKKGGMVSEIAENIPFQFVSIRHYGILDGEIEITDGPAVQEWAGGFENYSFSEKNGVTTVSVAIDVTNDFVAYFNTSWPKALVALKDLVENKNTNL
ncbi:SRPBCC domain-containing protein [Flavobacterium sp. UMI-01]|uniref:SRPBCC domain-containing protein n=1 Tax=Flavobacterium sp. UMI-01 TaxID=1441053 RepID=UPI001C7CBF4E|nr:SRPBCC domain-containing protein [Flavobacterium sp. UMI-01]GIZ08297.1 hypothetical protein FUMI01_10240 [Flavobacterium sp. UMI-01]